MAGFEVIARWLEGAGPGVVNHLWQSTAFAALAGLLALALRGNRARGRYWIWIAASVKFLLPFSLLVGLGGHLIQPTKQKVSVWPVQFPPVYQAVDTVSQPFTAAAHVVIVRGGRGQRAIENKETLAAMLPAIAAAIWLGGFLVVAGMWLVRWRRVALGARAAVPMPEGREADALRRVERRRGERRELPLLRSQAMMEPGVFGMWRPVLLWPEGISAYLSDAHLEAIFTHELEHVRHRDNLLALAQMFVEAVFWFHPLVWWMGGRMVAERERACDEEVLRRGNAPVVYAESILKTCEFCVEAPLACVAGVTGADLKKRMVQIMSRRLGSNLSLTKRLLVTAAAVAAIAGPVVFGLVYAAQVRAQTDAVVNNPKDLTGTWQGILQADKPLRIVMKMVKGSRGWDTSMLSVDEGPNARGVGMTTLLTGTVKYESLTNGGTFEGKMSADGGTIAGDWTMPGHAVLKMQLTRVTEAAAWKMPALATPPNPMAPDADPSFEVVTIKPSDPKAAIQVKSTRMNGRALSMGNVTLADLIEFAYDVNPKQIVDGPSWMDHDKFDVTGEPDKEGTPSMLQWKSMFRKMLAARFQLKFHQDKRDLAVYVLSVGKGGAKNLEKSMQGDERYSYGFHGTPGGLTLMVTNANMNNLVTGMQGGLLDRPVLDQTGITGRYNFQVTFALGGSEFGGKVPPPVPTDNPPPDMITAFQEQLGLKLESTKAPADVMVIDRAERPSEN